MEAAVSGERVVETWHAAMETALLCASTSHSITPERGQARLSVVVSFNSQPLTDEEEVTDFLLYLSSLMRRRLPW